MQEIPREQALQLLALQFEDLEPAEIECALDGVHGSLHEAACLLQIYTEEVPLQPIHPYPVSIKSCAPVHDHAPRNLHVHAFISQDVHNAGSKFAAQCVVSYVEV